MKALSPPMGPTVTRGIPMWITAMAGFMALVAAANVGLVWLSGRGHRDLVRPDYYAAGLVQDSLIARTAGSAAWAKGISLRRSGEGWMLEAPAAPEWATGAVVRLYRPDDERADRETRLQKTNAGAWTAAYPDLKRGRWIATVAWERDGRILGEASAILDAGN